MLTQSRFLLYWREAARILQARRWPALTMGEAHAYWMAGFSPEGAAVAERLLATFARRVLH